MKTRTYTALNLKSKGTQDAMEDIRKFGGFATTEVATRLMGYVQQFTPVGGRLSRRGRNAHAPGLMRASWRMAAVAKAAGRVYALGNSASYAQIINMGRRKNKHAYRVRIRGKFFKSGGGSYVVPANRRWLGSRQAPNILSVEGAVKAGAVTGPAWRRLKRDERSVSALAARQADSGGAA